MKGERTLPYGTLSRWTRSHWTGQEAEACAAWLLSLAEEDYLAFQGRLVSTATPMYGVRIPRIRSLAKEIARGNWREFLAVFHPAAYEELLLEGFVIGCARGELSEILGYVESFVPKIDNWAVNDSFVGALKIAGRYPAEVWRFLEPYLASEEEFSLRFGVTMLMSYYLTESYIDQVLARYQAVRHEGYYVKMAVAWGLSAAYVKFPERVTALLEESRLDVFTHNKTIQKIRESRRVSPEEKAALLRLRREERSGFHGKV